MSETTESGGRPAAASVAAGTGAPAPADTFAGAHASFGRRKRTDSSPGGTPHAEPSPGGTVRTEPSVGQFRIGGVLSKTFSVFFRNFVPFVLLALIVLSPNYIYALAAGADPVTAATSGTHSAVAVGMAILGFLLSYLLTAAVTYGTYQDLRGRKASLGEAVRRGLPLIFPVIGVTLIFGLVGGLAMMLLIIPGLIVMTMYFVVVPVAVIERKGVFASFSRSAELTKGCRWKIFGIILVITVISILLLGIGVAIFGGTIGMQANAGAAFATTDYVIRAITSAFSAVSYAVIYNDLRVAKEGIDVEQIAAVFD